MDEVNTVTFKLACAKCKKKMSSSSHVHFDRYPLLILKRDKISEKIHYHNNIHVFILIYYKEVYKCEKFGDIK